MTDSNWIRLFPFIAVLVLLTGCAKKMSNDAIVYQAYEPVNEKVPTYSKTLLEDWPQGRPMDPADVERVRYPDAIHTYHLGRLPTRDRRSMHEAHQVYRIEQSAEWDQRLPATPMRPLGVVTGIRSPLHQPLPADKVIEAERLRQRELSRQMQDTQQKLSDLETKLATRVNEYQDSSQVVARMQSQIGELTSQRDALSSQLEVTEARLREVQGLLQLQQQDGDFIQQSFGSELEEPADSEN